LRTLAALAFWQDRWLQMAGTTPDLPISKVFSPKYDLPKIEGKVASNEFWAKFPQNKQKVGSSLINPVRLESLARSIGIEIDGMVKTVITDLKFGANIGCYGAARGASRSGNAPACEEFADHISDVIASWVDKGFAAGPFTEEELPAEAKVNGILCRQKPNGAVRVILNMSAPLGMSVNDGIDADQFPTKMSSTGKWLKCLNLAGRGCYMTKVDWADAYKHIHVNDKDLDLQWFQWKGRYFFERCLIFGSASSPGIYDRTAKVVLNMALAMSRFPRTMVCQYLDDVCAASQPGRTPGVRDFREAYAKVAAEVGVRLAPEDDPEKAFGPRHDGTVLGIHYNTLNWTWEIPADKLGRLIHQIDQALAAEWLWQEQIWSLVGRIIHYAPLVRDGRFHIRHLIKANNLSKMKKYRVALETGAKRQLAFWRAFLLTSSGLATIPAVPIVAPAWAFRCYTDAAGGSRNTPGLGCGGVLDGGWFFQHWSDAINGGMECNGKRVGGKMSALELVGPLIALSVWADRFRCGAVVFFVDNAGSVCIWQKGYSSSCPLASTLVAAMAAVAAGIGATVCVEKITRCSDPGTVMADALSKSAFGKFWEAATATDWALPPEPEAVPRSILRWLANPLPDEDLGTKILKELSQTVPMLGLNTDTVLSK